MSQIQATFPAVSPIGETYDVPCEQQVQGPLTDGVSVIQFSNAEHGPWVTAQAGSGEVRGVPMPWTAEDTEFTQQGAAHGSVWQRVGIWGVTADPYNSDPVMFSNVEWVKGLHVQGRGAP